MGIVKQMWLEQMDDEEFDRQLEDITAEAFSKCAVLQADHARRYAHEWNTIEMAHDEYEFRYERRGDAFILKRWSNGSEKTERGLVATPPAWLLPILDVAKVSGHLRKTVEPPPDEILWFRTDDKCNLTTFIDLEYPNQ